ncbi:MAG: PEP-utilizing enzyme [Actinomycetota bacterium]
MIGDGKVLARGRPAVPGAVTGCVLTDPVEAERRASEGSLVILAVTTTSPQLLPVVTSAAGVITELGGLASHAALVCRELATPCVVGCGPDTVTQLDGTWAILDAERGELRRATPPVDADHEVAADGTSGRAVESATVALDDEHLVTLQAARLRGVTDESDLSAILQLRHGVAERHVALLEHVGLVSASAEGVRVTTSGHHRIEEWLVDERRQVDGSALTAFHEGDEWNRQNDQFEHIATAWYVRDGVDNDHTDAAYDAAVLRDLLDLGERWTIGRIAADLRARLGSYDRRFRTALTAVRAGDARWFLGLSVDSFHRVLFELHQEMYDLAPGTREEHERARHVRLVGRRELLGLDETLEIRDP